MNLNDGLITTDCSPIGPLSSELDEWVREVACKARPAEMVIGFATNNQRDYESVLRFDVQSACWWTGRYVGEISYKGRTLQILPRFGMPALHRWLSRVYGIQLVESHGEYTAERIWLWELIAHLWSARLVLAAKHGLPHRRVDEIHSGPSVRGRLLIKESIRDLSIRSGILTSQTRERKIDSVISGIILLAHEQLQRMLGASSARLWLTERGATIVDALRSDGVQATYATNKPIRYTPITESFRPLVELSLSILRQRPLSSSVSGDKEVSGVLLDMAEIWELYLLNVIRSGLPSLEVVYTARDAKEPRYMLRGSQNGLLQQIRPDVLLREPFGGRILGIIDAKYKNTRPSSDKPWGVDREDLYQMSAYLSAIGQTGYPMSAFLIYPVGSEWFGPDAGENPWYLPASPQKNLSFLGVAVDTTSDENAFAVAEQQLADSISNLIGQDQQRTAGKDISRQE